MQVVFPRFVVIAAYCYRSQDGLPLVCGDARSVRFHTVSPHILRAVARLKLHCPGWLAALVTTGVGSGDPGERFTAWSAVVDDIPNRDADRRSTSTLSDRRPTDQPRTAGLLNIDPVTPAY